jgi:enoyl-CoA hydratase/carnithine racemase
MQLLVTAEPIDAARAHEIGLVNAVVPTADLRGAAQAMAATILANAPLSVRAAKRTVHLGARDVFDEAERLWEPVYRSADAQEGPAAFREGRAPRWQGR